jgi:hypothetical protein
MGKSAKGKKNLKNIRKTRKLGKVKGKLTAEESKRCANMDRNILKSEKSYGSFSSQGLNCVFAGGGG